MEGPQAPQVVGGEEVPFPEAQCHTLEELVPVVAMEGFEREGLAAAMAVAGRKVVMLAGMC